MDYLHVHADNPWYNYDMLLFFAERDGSYDPSNIAALPVQTDQLCGSPDAVQYLWSYGCHVTEVVTQFERETEENKCM